MVNLLSSIQYHSLKQVLGNQSCNSNNLSSGRIHSKYWYTLDYIITNSGMNS